MPVSRTIEARGGMLVAHDGSADADRALRTAVRLAAALGVHVSVVRAWSVSTAPRPDSWEPNFMPPFEDFEAATLVALDADVQKVRIESPDVEIVTAVVHGAPAEKLIDASGSVDLVVVGSRGHGGFAGLRLGSVSEQVVRHAHCPVLVDKAAEGDEPVPVEKRQQMEDALASELNLD
ncbi:universal stress protein [Aeromicrobium sp.]|uniref:universal stress protein n=1 Tax=Aeromicrobium sp. TaxID=1871063 RepID=UPI0025BB6979|nr:universal stress protein [Aeromicrobium sp.]